MSDPRSTAARLRSSRPGDLLPDELLGSRPARRIDAAAIVLPGPEPLDRYLATLAGAADEFSAWDGRVVKLPPDGGAAHRVLVADRYGQVYEVVDAFDPAALPDAEALEEWFRFLATACPECGVIDDPRGRDFVP